MVVEPDLEDPVHMEKEYVTAIAARELAELGALGSSVRVSAVCFVITCW